MEDEPPPLLSLPSSDKTTGAFPGAVDLDPGNLLVSEPFGPDPASLAADATAACLAHGRDVFQRLVNALFVLPTAADQGLVLGRVVSLPPPAARLPREKPLPTPRPPTRWEAFAKEKGIVKRKRSARVWDEASHAWVRRHGFGRAERAEDVLVAARAGEEEGAGDPFAAARAERRARTAAQTGRRARNLEAARGAGAAPPPGVALSASLPLSRGGGGGGGAQQPPPPLDVAGLKRAKQLAAVSTASLGKFDKRLDEDKPGVRPRVGGRKRAFTPVADTARDRASMAAALGALQRKDALATNLDVGRAVNAVAKAPRPQGRHGAKAKLGGGKKQKR